ncbi:MAG: hypothetical protein LBV21_07300 [Candidatus Adiutrix sp.]|jgi:hypothetical protein|nr:hypothetical protein [Candidatus Adiutrix sp.]
MKKMAFSLALVTLLGAAPAFSGDETPTVEVLAAETPPPFTLSPQKDDSPTLTRQKAALRLMKSAQVTTRVLQYCADATPEAGPALSGFNSRNGNTLALILKVIKSTGGVTPEIKALLEREVTAAMEETLRKSDCLTLAIQVRESERDIYKAPDLAEDYALVRGR